MKPTSPCKKPKGSKALNPYLAVLSLLALGSSGCASVSLESNLTQAHQYSRAFNPQDITLASTQAQHQALRAQADAILQQPLSQQHAIALMLANSPAFAALLARGHSEAALAAQAGRLGNPVLQFERIKNGDELEIGRLLGFGLSELVTLPWRSQAAKHKVQHKQLALSQAVLEHMAKTSTAWVNAVAAQEKATYAQQVQENAQASAELAKRMEAVGNFSQSQRLREQLLYSEAILELAQARQEAVASTEQLVRLLGLDESQRQQLKLPQQLPPLPQTPKAAQDLGQAAATTRLDVQMAKLDYDAALKRQGVDTVGSFVDVEAGLRRDTVFDNDSGRKTAPKGYELELRLPLFDWGGMQRQAMQAELLAKANTLEAVLRSASSSLRERYHHYRTAYEVAQHYQTEVLPMLNAQAQQNLLRYNGMFISTFELMAERRSQVRGVQQSIDALANFWRADVALQAELLGSPIALELEPNKPQADRQAAGGH